MGARDEYVKGLKSAAASLGTNALYAALCAEVPIFANPFLGFFAKQIISEALEFLLDKTEFGAFFIFIDLRVNQQGRAFYEAAVANQKAKLGGSPEEKARAEKQLLESFRALVVLTN